MTARIGIVQPLEEALAHVHELRFQNIKSAGEPRRRPRYINVLEVGFLYPLTFCLRALFAVFRLSPLAAIAKLRSRSFSNILIFSEKLSEASFLRVSFLLMSASKIPALKLLPL